MFRTVGPASDLDAVLAPLGDLVEITQVLEVPAVHLKIVDGFETASFSFTTDIPFLGNWGEPLLFGPGSILVAHTDDEHVGIEELEAAAEGYQRLAQQLLR
jgi:acetylornithine deacetylase